MIYKLLITNPIVLDIEAKTEQDTIQQAKQQLINTHQIKPLDPISILVVEEGKIVENTDINESIKEENKENKKNEENMKK